MEKPMRHEEYLAIAEENRRLTNELESIRQKKQSDSIRKEAVSNVVSVIFAFLLFLFPFTVFCALGSEQPTTNNLCYYIISDRQLHHDVPWNMYYIYEALDVGVVGTPTNTPKFETYQQALDFMKRWNLTCQ